MSLWIFEGRDELGRPGRFLSVAYPIPMQVESFAFNPFMTNCYLCHDQGEAVLVDASCDTEAECAQVKGIIDEYGLEAQFGQRFQAHEAATPFIERAEDQAMAFGVEVDPPSVPTTFLAEGDTVSFGGVTLEVLHTPGHSPDSISFVDRASRQALTGDVLFQNSIGRTQGLPETSRTQLLDSVTEKLLPLGDDFTIYPGHGPATTIGQERAQNPFVQEALQE